MEQLVRRLMLIIAMMFGVIPVNTAQAEGIPFEFHAPFPYGETYDGGGHGSYYNQGKHTGTSKYCIDFNQGSGSEDENNPVTATAGGIVVADRDSDHNGYHTGYPDDVAIRHEDGWYSLYMHLNSNSVSVGDEVRAGQVIGKIGGQTGYDPHLHFCIFNSVGESVMPTPMDGTIYDDNGADRDVTSNNSEVTEEAFNAIRTKADELWNIRPTNSGKICDGKPDKASGLICHETENMHWYSGIDARHTSFVIEDWTDGTWGWVGITFDPTNVDQDRAYVLRHKFWENYRNNGGPDKFGAPIGDEMDITRQDEYHAYDPYCMGQLGYTTPEQCIKLFCGSTEHYSSVQRFSDPVHGTLCWNTTYGYACESGFNCPEDLTSEPYAVNSTTSWTYNSLDLTSLAPIDYAHLQSSVSCGITTQNHMLSVVLNGQDGNVYELYSTDGEKTWGSSNLSIASHVWVPYAMPGTSPHLFIDQATGTRYVAYLGQDLGIWVFTITPNHQLTVSDISRLIWVPYLDPWSELKGTVSSDGTLHLVFSSNTGDVWLLSGQGTSWVTMNLASLVWLPYPRVGTSFSISVDAMGNRFIAYTSDYLGLWLVTVSPHNAVTAYNLASLVWLPDLDPGSTPSLEVQGNGQLKLAFTSITGDLWEVIGSGTSWTGTNLSSLVWLPLIQPNTSPSLIKDRITFQANNARIWQVPWNGLGPVDLTSQDAVDYAAPGTSPVSCVDTTTGTRHTMFVGSNARIQSMRWGP